MHIVYAILSALGFLAWAAHQHIQMVLAGHVLFSGSLLQVLVGLLFMTIAAVILATVRVIVRDAVPARS